MNRKRDMTVGIAFLIVLGVSCLYVLGGTEDEKGGISSTGLSSTGLSSTGLNHAQSEWIWNDYELALNEAGTENKLVLIDFWAVWCKECKEMNEEAFENPEVKYLLENFVLLIVDVDEVPSLKAQFLVVGMPTVLVVNSNGEEVARAVGYQNAEQLKKILEEVLHG
jgi:thiol:disulfide interchange protein